jgi:hypothetical protein
MRKTYLLHNSIILFKVLLMSRYEHGKVMAPIDYQTFEEAMERQIFPRAEC